MKIPCPTCDRLGKLPKKYPMGTIISYCGRDGEVVPYETCKTCNGEGWIDDKNKEK